VGPIEDEFDQEEPARPTNSEQAWVVNGSLPAHKLDELVGEDLGLRAKRARVRLDDQRLGRFPRVGDVLTFGVWELAGRELAGTRVARMKLAPRTKRR